MSESVFTKVAVSVESDQALSEAVERVNRSFDGGRVTKTDLASWLLLRSASSLDDSTIEEIHRAHFNQVAYLDNLVKKLKSTGRDNLGPEELATLQAMLGQQSTKKRPKVAKSDENKSEHAT